MSNEQVAPPERIWLSRGHPGDSWEWTGCWSPRPHPKGHESTEYIRLDLVEQESLNDRIPNLDRPPAKKWTETPMAERYPPSDTAALAKQGSPRCVKCGHGRVGENGHCVIPVRESDGEDVIEGLCGCKCEFALAKQGSPPADEITAIAERNYYLGLQHGAKEWRHLKPEAWHCQKCAAQLVYDGESYVCNRCERLWPAENIVLFAYADLSDEMFITKGTP